MDQGETHLAPGISQSFWELTGTPAPLDNQDQAIFVVGLMENDDGDPETMRGIVKGIVGGSVYGSLSFGRPDKVTALIRDVNSALGTPTGAPNFDDKVGAPQELRFSREELAQAKSGSTVSKTLVFRRDGGRYTLKFEARAPGKFLNWQLLDNNPASIDIVADGNNLYQLHSNGRIWKYTGTPLTGWQELDNNPATKMIAASGGNLYQLHSNGRIWKYTGTPLTGWQELDNNPATKKIVADGNNLYQLHSNGRIWKYTGTPLTGWQELDNNPATKMIAASGGNLYQLHSNGRIWKYTGTPLTGWQELDNNPASIDIVADGNNLYQIHNNGFIWRYTG